MSNRSSQLAPHIKKSCSSLLSRQLLRPEGVRGLCAAVFGEGEGVDEDASLEKLDHVARVLGTPPAAVKHEARSPSQLNSIHSYTNDLQYDIGIFRYHCHTYTISHLLRGQRSGGLSSCRFIFAISNALGIQPSSNSRTRHPLSHITCTFS